MGEVSPKATERGYDVGRGGALSPVPAGAGTLPLNAGEKSLHPRGRWHGEAMTEGACDTFIFRALPHPSKLGSSLPEGAYQSYHSLNAGEKT